MKYLLATLVAANIVRPHGQLPTPFIHNGNWLWAFEEDIRQGFPHRCDGGTPDVGTYVFLNTWETVDLATGCGNYIK